MKKLFKKSIALVLSAALCLTALIGCLTVSADGTATTETTKPAFILGTASGKAGETVNLDGSVTVISGISAHDVSFTFPAGFEVLSVSGDPGLVNGDELNGTESDTSAQASETSENSNYVKDQDYTEETVDGKTVIRFVNTSEPQTLTTYDISFSVKIGTGAAHGDNTVAVTGEYAKDTGAGEDWVDVDLTDGKISVHNWDDGVMTTMPTTTSNGVVTHTCTEEGCSVTKTEDFVVDGTITMNAAKTGNDVASVQLKYGSTLSAGLFTSLENSGATEISFGVLLTKDGSVPVVKDGATVLFQYTGNIPEGKNGSANGYFRGMNFAQMGQTLTFRTYVQFKLNGHVCYYYGTAYSKVFIDEIRSNSDEQSQALVSLYDGKAAATNINSQCAGDVIESGVDGITTNATKTTFDLNEIKVYYGSTLSASLFTSLENSGATEISFGVLLTKDGSVPVVKDGATVLFQYTGNIPEGKNGSANGYFRGMNFAQMGQTLTFRTYVKYRNASGDYEYNYGPAVSFVYIDILRTLAGENTYANQLLNYYDGYVGK